MDETTPAEDGWSEYSVLSNVYGDTYDSLYAYDVQDYWVVVYLDGSIYVVDGSTGACGQEKRVAGPFDTIDEAKTLAFMMYVTEGRTNTCRP